MAGSGADREGPPRISTHTHNIYTVLTELTLLHSIYLRPSTLACLAAIALCGTAAQAQQRPDSGTNQQQPERQIQKLPDLVAPDVTTKIVKRALVGSDVKVTPSAFRFTGNTLIPEADLQAVVAGLVGKETDFNGLVDAAAALRQLYTSKGYVLTDVYLPEQQFSSAGGIVEFAVIEARLGTVSVKVTDGSGVSQSFATGLAETYLVPGMLLSQEILDKPVLLLRDMAGADAEATVVPGANPGEANVEIAVTPRGPRFEPYVSADNYGTYSAGAYRFAAGVSVNAPFGLGDVFTARVQGADRGGNALYSLSYGLALGGYGTKVSTSYSYSEYQLGKQFENLNATGRAEVAAISTVHPLVRSRFTNLFASAGVEGKLLRDNNETGGSNDQRRKRVVLARFGVLGNHTDRLLFGGTTSFSATVSGGHLWLYGQERTDDRVSRARTAGNFSKFNLELQRVEYITDRSSVLLSFNGQYATKNLTSAEKISIGGPDGVRGYPIGEGVGDQGLTLSVEYRYLTGLRIFGAGMSLTAFYDYGLIRQDRIPYQTTQGRNSTNLDSVGVGVLLGREGSYTLTAGVATRIGGQAPTSGDPDYRPRGWFSLQKWF